NCRCVQHAATDGQSLGFCFANVTAADPGVGDALLQAALASLRVPRDKPYISRSYAERARRPIARGLGAVAERGAVAATLQQRRATARPTCGAGSVARPRRSPSPGGRRAARLLRAKPRAARAALGS